MTQNNSTPQIKLPIPHGWRLIDRFFLAQQSQLTSSEVITFFDGATPRWQEALDGQQIRQRGVVQQLVSRLEKNRITTLPQLLVFTGPTGEGKTTALMQAVCQLVQERQHWRVIWNEEPERPFEPGWIKALPQQRTDTWLIVSDGIDALLTPQKNAHKRSGPHSEDTQNPLLGLLQELQRRGRRDVQFLLCCRDTDWNTAALDMASLRHVAAYDPFPMPALDLADAEALITSWEQQGAAGLGELQHIAPQERVPRLLQAAASETDKQESALLGAMLQLRYGDTFTNHVRSLMLRLQKQKAPGGTLLHAFASIFVPHAEGLRDKQGQLMVPYRSMLAEALDCTVDEINRKIIKPLGREAAGAVSKQFVYARHRSIAQAAVVILQDMVDRGEFDTDIDQIYANLACSAERAKKAYGDVPVLTEWRYLSKQFAEQGQRERAVTMVRALIQESKGETSFTYFVTDLSKLYRDQGKPELALKVFHEHARYADRVYFYEWATAEGEAFYYENDAWLSAVSLADTIRGEFDLRRIKYSLNGLATAFRHLSERYYDEEVFIQARLAAAYLGLHRALNAGTYPQEETVLRKTDAALRRHREECEKAGYSIMDSQLAFEQFQQGTLRAWEQAAGSLPSVPPPTQLRFEQLARKLNIEYKTM
ncbi:MAG: hypothetical protein MUD01_05040 [Chloroflexaceae bacterium]|jgi:hypothetical protein|nr:hypothetical protein [Chloroflexaceae bacterium]